MYVLELKVSSEAGIEITVVGLKYDGFVSPCAKTNLGTGKMDSVSGRRLWFKPTDCSRPTLGEI
jgi:hypothetical protein